MFIGEVLSDFRLLMWPFATCPCIICLGIALFFFFFWIIKNLLPKGQDPNKLKNSTKPKATT